MHIRRHQFHAQNQRTYLFHFRIKYIPTFQTAFVLYVTKVHSQKLNTLTENTVGLFIDLAHWQTKKARNFEFDSG